MQRLVYFLLIVGFFFSTLSAQDYFEELGGARKSIDSLIEYIDNIEANSMEEHVLRELQGAGNRLGAAQSELYVLELMGWLLDLGRQYEMLENEAFIIFEQDFVQEIERLFAGETTRPALDLWVREQDCIFLIQAVARSLFNLSAELAFSAIQNPSASHVYNLLMEVIRSLYALARRDLPSIGTFQLSPRTLVLLAPHDNDTDVAQVQQRTPRRGSLSPRENFDLPNKGVGLNVVTPYAIVFHQRAASTGHSVLEFQKYAQ